MKEQFKVLLSGGGLKISSMLKDDWSAQEFKDFSWEVRNESWENEIYSKDHRNGDRSSR